MLGLVLVVVCCWPDRAPPSSEREGRGVVYGVVCLRDLSAPVGADTAEALKPRLEAFHSQTVPLLDHYKPVVRVRCGVHRNS